MQKNGDFFKKSLAKSEIGDILYDITRGSSSVG